LAEIQSLVSRIPAPSQPGQSTQPGQSAQPGPVVGDTPATEPDPITASPKLEIGEVVIVETPTGLVVGVKAGKDVKTAVIRAIDSNGKIYSFTASAAALEATLLDLPKGRQYKLEVIPYSANGIQGTSYQTLVNTRPNNPLAIDVAREANGRIGVDWSEPNGFVAGYRVEVSVGGKLVFQATSSRSAMLLPANVSAGRITVIALGEGGSETSATAFNVTSKTTIGAATVRYATRDSKTLISFPVKAKSGTAFKVFVNGKQVCSTKINSCTVKRQLLPNDSIRVVSSDGATSPSTHLFDKFSFTGELNFVPNSAKPAANFEVQLKRLVAQLKAGGFKKVVVTGHANLLGSKPTANSSRLATARGAVVAKRLKAMLPGVEILVVNRSVFSPLVAANSTKNIRAEVYAVK